MTTSLAEQLKRLAVPQTSILKRDKKRASLLFDPKDAATLRKDTVYQIGLEGLEELISKNFVFETYRNSLFHMSSKDFERSVEDTEANRKLDKSISKFLLHLSPYFLLNACHKSLEWLIYRYSIHEYNREDLLMLSLPYHESNIFIRIVQILQFKEHSDPWYFLQSLQKPGVHLTKQALLNHAASSPYFLKCIRKYMSQLIKGHEDHTILTVAFNFYCSTYTGSIEYCKELSEDQVSQMLPIILKGLNSNIPDFCAASYVIVARLVVKTQLSEELLHKFINKISDVNVPGLKTEACLVLLVLFQSQTHFTDLSAEALQNLGEKDWLPNVMEDLNSSGSFIYPFLSVLIRKFVVRGTEDDSSKDRIMVTNLIDQIKLDNDYVGIVLESILDGIKIKMKYSEDALNWLTETVQLLERQYPTPFDKIVYTILTSSSGSELRKRRKCLQKILKNTIIYKGKFNIFEKLYHSNPQIRGETVKYLKNHFSDLSQDQKESLRKCFLDRLNDDDVKVVQESLNLIVKTSVVKGNDLKFSLMKLLRKCKFDKKGFGEISDRVLKMLCSEANPNDWEIFLSIFPYLLPIGENDIKKAHTVLNSSFCIKNNVLSTYRSKLLSSRNSNEFSKNVIEALRTNRNLDSIKSFLLILKKSDNQDTLHNFLSSVILTNLLPENSPLELSCDILDTVLKNYESSTGKSNKNKKNLASFMKLAAKNKFPSYGFLQCLKNIIENTKVSNDNIHLMDFSLNDKLKHFIVCLINSLSVQSSFYQDTFELFLTKICKIPVTKFEFLLNISASGQLKESVVENLLTYCIKEFSDNAETLKTNFKLESKFVIWILIVLHTNTKDLRILVLELIELLLQMKLDKQNAFTVVLEGIIKHKEEITVDHEQIPLVLNKLMQNNVAKKNSKVLNFRNILVDSSWNNKCPLYMQANILKLISLIEIPNMLNVTSEVALNFLLNDPELITGFKASIIVSNISRIDNNVVKNLEVDSNAYKFITACLKADKTLLRTEEKTISPVVLVLNKFTKDIFTNLDEVVIKSILDHIIEISTISNNNEVMPAAARVFKHIDLDSNFIIEHLHQMCIVQNPKQVSKKSRRISTIPTIDILDTIQWRKGVTVLEFLQDKKKIRNLNNLIVILFKLLKRCLDFDEQTVVEYTKQLILSLILHCCQKDEEKIPEDILEMSLVVQCIRASQNPQTHHHALLVLATVAEIIPHKILQHMIPIFTFVGSSILRHDDAYSFQIMAKIIDTVIPILISDNEIGTVAGVLQTFVDALLDVPEHKRQPLYIQLLQKIDAEKNLYLFLLLVFESRVVHSAQDKQANIGPKRLNIAANLCREFSPYITINTCIKLIQYLRELPYEKIENSETPRNCVTFNIANYTATQFRHYKFVLISFVANFLSSQEFVNQIASLTDSETLELENLYKELIVQILTYIQKTVVVAEKNSNTPQSQYWKSHLHYSYDILESTNALLTPQMFLLVTRGLMVHKLPTVRRRSLELLNNKLQFNTAFFNDYKKTELYALITPIINIIETLDCDELTNEQEQIIQTALLSLKLLIKYLAADDREKFVPILNFITNLIRSGKAQSNILASTLLCLAELCVNLRAHAITCLPEYMPAIIKILKHQKGTETSNVLLLSTLTTLQKIFDSLPLFLSPYLEKLLMEFSQLNCKFQSADDPKVQPTVNKLIAIKQKLGNTIPARILIPAVEGCYNNLLQKKSFSAITALVDILGESLNNLQGSDITSNLTELTTFFLSALQFRADGIASLEETNHVESHIIKAFTVLILKLSESSFRPLHYKLFDWARNNEQPERLITFYSLSSSIAKSLKGLYVLFAGHFLNNAAKLLDTCNTCKNENLCFEDDNKNNLLLKNVLETLHCIFLYDNQKFINKDRFEVLMQPLVDQLENSLGGIDCLLQRCNDILIPCLVQFTVVIADDALWKQMNYQILLKMRHDTPKIRLAALHCLSEIVKKVGEDFLPLLPETIPFLAELLEDEEETVEKACRKAVQEMEKVLGEPLQKYF